MIQKNPNRLHIDQNFEEYYKINNFYYHWSPESKNFVYPTKWASIYSNSLPIFEDRYGSNIIEISGYMPLYKKMEWWKRYGAKKESLYYSVECNQIFPASRSYLVSENPDMEWSIGWISEFDDVYVFVEMLKLLYDYHIIYRVRRNNV